MNTKNLFSQPDLDKIGERVKRDIEASIHERGGMSLRFDALAAYHRNEPPRQPHPYLPGSTMLNFPLLSPRINKLAGSTTRTLTNPDTMLVGKLMGQAGRAEEVEQTLQHFFECGAIENALRQHAEAAGLTNNAIIRARFDAIESNYYEAIPEGAVTLFGKWAYVGFVFDVIHPSDFIVWPSTPFGIRAARTVGNRTWITRREIKHAQQVGRMLKVDLPSPDSPFSHQGPRNYSFDRLTPAESDEDTQAFQCWDVCTCIEVGGRREMFRVTLLFDTAKVLSIERFYQTPWYAMGRFRAREGGSCWAGKSVGNDLQGLQIAYNLTQNMQMVASFASAMPALVGPGLPEKIVKWMPGDLINSQGAISAIQNNYRHDGLFGMGQLLERLADTVAHIPQTAIAGQLRPGITASEVQASVAGQQSAENDYLIEYGTSTLVPLAQSMREQLWANWPLVMEAHGSAVALTDRNALLRPIRFAIQGRNPETTPDIQRARLESLWDRAMAFQGEDGSNVLGFNVQEIAQTWLNTFQLSNADKILVPPQAAHSLEDEPEQQPSIFAPSLRIA